MSNSASFHESSLAYFIYHIFQPFPPVLDIIQSVPNLQWFLPAMRCNNFLLVKIDPNAHANAERLVFHQFLQYAFLLRNYCLVCFPCPPYLKFSTFFPCIYILIPLISIKARKKHLQMIISSVSASLIYKNMFD